MDVGLNVYSFAVRTPGRPAQKYQLKAYDESILAPMVMFEPRVIDFDRKELRSSAFLSRGVEEDIQEIPGERMVSQRPTSLACICSRSTVCSYSYLDGSLTADAGNGPSSSHTSGGT
jgi:hypothetical protein